MAGRYIDVAVKVETAGTVDQLYVRDGETSKDAVERHLKDGEEKLADADICRVVEEIDAKTVKVSDLMELHPSEETKQLNIDYPNGNPAEEEVENNGGEDEPVEDSGGTGFIR